MVQLLKGLVRRLCGKLEYPAGGDCRVLRSRLRILIVNDGAQKRGFLADFCEGYEGFLHGVGATICRPHTHQAKAQKGTFLRIHALIVAKTRITAYRMARFGPLSGGGVSA